MPYYPILLVKHNYCSIPITVNWCQTEIKIILWSLSLIWNRTHTTISYRRRIPIPVTQGRAQKTFLWLLSFNWNGDSTRSNYNMIPIPVKWSHSASLFLNENTTSFMFYLLKSENKPKRFRSETFFWVSSWNFLNNGFPTSFYCFWVQYCYLYAMIPLL